MLDKVQQALRLFVFLDMVLLCFVTFPSGCSIKEEPVQEEVFTYESLLPSKEEIFPDGIFTVIDEDDGGSFIYTVENWTDTQFREFVDGCKELGFTDISFDTVHAYGAYTVDGIYFVQLDVDESSGTLYIICQTSKHEEKKMEEASVSVHDFIRVASKNTGNLPLELQIQIAEENRLGDMELLSQLVQAEAGNQGLEGMRLVARVVLNRVKSKRFPNTIEEVIFEPGQFACITDGNFDRAAWHMSEEAFRAVELEMESNSNPGILYFATSHVNGKNPFRVGGHVFSY